MNTDTLHHVNAVIQQASAIDHSLEIIQKVNTFYDSAWQKLLFFITIALAVVGVIIPFFLQRTQSRQLKIDSANLKLEFSTLINKAKEDLTNEINENLAKKFKKLDDSFDLLRAEIYARHFHLQGNLLDSSNKESAICSYLAAVEFYMKAKDKEAQTEMLRALVITLKKNGVYKDVLDRWLGNYTISLNKIIGEVSKNDMNGTLTDIGAKIILLYQDLKDKPKILPK
jgi:hypothetical protein